MKFFFRIPSVIFYFVLINLAFSSCIGAKYNLPGHTDVKKNVNAVNSYEYTLFKPSSSELDSSLNKLDDIKSTVFYDKKGRIIQKLVFSKKLGNFKSNYFYRRTGFLKKIETVDSNGIIIQELKFSRLPQRRIKLVKIQNSKRPIVQKETVYYFNKEGKIVKVLNPEGNRFTTHIFNEKGLEISMSTFLRDTLLQKIDYTYDADGAQYRTVYDGKNQIIQKATNKTKDHLSTLTIHSFNSNKTDTMVIKQKEHFDKMGNLIKTWIEENDSGLFTVKEFEIRYK